MSRKRKLWIASGLLLAASVITGLWANSNYRMLKSARTAGYGLDGYSSGTAAVLAAQEAGSAMLGPTVAGWVLFGAALLSGVLAIAAKPETLH